MEKGRSFGMRYLIIVLVFCVIATIYLGRLFYIQISGRESSPDPSNTVREVTVQAVRGEIYDRNGKKLVGNLYTYDLSLSFSSYASMSTHEKNEAYLKLAAALGSHGVRLTGGDLYFPFRNSYPFYNAYTKEATDGESTVHYRLLQVLEDAGLDENASPQKLCAQFESKYELLAKDKDGKRLYTDTEVDVLMRLYYDMEAKRFEKNGEYTIAKDVSLDLIAALKEQKLGCVDFTVNVQREYLYPGYASHILGSVGPIYQEEWEYYSELGYQMNAIVGKSGCESAFQEYLGGKEGKLRIEEDAFGNVLNVTVIEEPVAGKDVYLTLDIDLQIAAEEGLAENVAYVREASGGIASRGDGCDAGAAVVLDPDTFEVLAIASHPSYDLSTFSEDYDALRENEALPLFNRALMGSYEPGSTFKLGMAAIALMHGELAHGEVIDCTGEYPNASVSGSVGCSTYGIYHTSGVDLVHAIAYSCNSFFCELGSRLGISAMEHYMGKFGFGKPTGFELGGIDGIMAGPTHRAEINHEEAWREGNTWQAAIGQSDNQASPLQLATYMGTLANGGTRYTAHLLHSVYAFGSDTPLYTFRQSEETVLDRIEISEKALAAVLEGMREVVADEAAGSIVRRFIDEDIPVTVGGKTGTAQNSGPCDNALFVSAAPYDDPEIVISVVLEEGYMGAYAALTAGRILEAYFSAS
ncbi:MAG: hypothetical protein E7643_06315 [Ruminococcaceae bacterium]|nr:hypothetical protein [Oscillospiraceae bacterium]